MDMNQIKNFAPIIIPTLNRFEHLKKCIESLSLCTHASCTDLIIGVDFPPSEKYMNGYNKIIDYLESGINGFKSIRVIKHEKNMGAKGNSDFLKKIAFRQYDKIILTEDDNVFSPNFLDFMNKTLSIFEYDCQVTSVTGYSMVEFASLELSNNIIFTKNNSAWGIGLWKNKEKEYNNINVNYYKKILYNNANVIKLIRLYPAVLLMLIDMLRKGTFYGDTMRTCRNIIEGYFQVCPHKSLVRNLGHDGSGLHCGNMYNDYFSKQNIDTEEIFKIRDINIQYNKSIKNIERRFSMPKNRFKRFLRYIRILLEILKYRTSQTCNIRY